MFLFLAINQIQAMIAAGALQVHEEIQKIHLKTQRGLLFDLCNKQLK